MPDLAHHFFRRCLAAEVTPYVVTKKTVFKWQEGFWAAMKEVFDAHYKDEYIAAGLLEKRCGAVEKMPSPSLFCHSSPFPPHPSPVAAPIRERRARLEAPAQKRGGVPRPRERALGRGKDEGVDPFATGRCGNELPHLISDAATMQIIRWTDGGFGMAAHNYDGDMLTDEVSQVWILRSPLDLHVVSSCNLTVLLPLAGAPQPRLHHFQPHRQAARGRRDDQGV